jgi:glycerophosphoryl diester phosphodiesterase
VKEFPAAEPAERLIRRFSAHERVVIGSSESDVMERFYRSGLRTCASMADASWMIPYAVAGLTPPKPRYDVLSITPNFHGFPIPVSRMAAAARKNGTATHVWTINEVSVAMELWAAGVSGIVTDDPAAMVRARAG